MLGGDCIASDETSPLWQATSESLINARATLVISLNGIDETVYHSLHAPYTYSASDLLWNHRLVDLFHYNSQGQQYIDFKSFHEVEPLDK